MVETDAKLEQALKAAEARARDRRQRLSWTAATGSSYALDALLLAGFVYLGAVPVAVLALFACGAAAACVAVLALYASGWNLKLRDPSAVAPQVAAGVALHLTVVALAPQILFPAIANLFTVFAFGFLWLSVRGAIVLWALSVAAVAAVMAQVGPHAAAAVATPREAALSWLCFSAVLARCLLLSVYAADMRTRLGDSRRRLAASLAQVKELASHDELTRTLNRRALLAQLEQERARTERTGAPFCIAMLDLDNFKAINDSYGHAAGDAVLRGFAAAVRQTMRATDVFGRYGGEEFLMILLATQGEEAREALERIRVAIEKADWRAITPGRGVTVSAGLACHRKGENMEQLLHRADQALYQAKHAGRNRVVASAA